MIETNFLLAISMHFQAGIKQVGNGKNFDNHHLVNQYNLTYSYYNWHCNRRMLVGKDNLYFNHKNVRLVFQVKKTEFLINIHADFSQLLPLNSIFKT